MRKSIESADPGWSIFRIWLSLSSSDLPASLWGLVLGGLSLLMAIWLPVMPGSLSSPPSSQQPLWGKGFPFSVILRKKKGPSLSFIGFEQPDLVTQPSLNQLLWPRWCDALIGQPESCAHPPAEDGINFTRTTRIRSKGEAMSQGNQGTGARRRGLRPDKAIPLMEEMKDHVGNLVTWWARTIRLNDGGRPIQSQASLSLALPRDNLDSRI